LADVFIVLVRYPTAVMVIIITYMDMGVVQCLESCHIDIKLMVLKWVAGFVNIS